MVTLAKSLKSLPAQFLFTIALANYAFSYAFRNSYHGYVESIAAVQKSTATCMVPGSAPLAVYSIYLVFGLGTFVISVYVFAAIYKLSFILLVLICPVKIVNMKKRWNNVPLDYNQYENEFDFNCDPEDPPCYDNAI